MKTRHLMLAAILSAVTAHAPLALALEAPKERPILTISGKIGETNAGTTARFDMKMLEALPQQTFTTRTPWYDKPVKFSGPLLADVMAAVKASGNTINAVAINDYKISIPAADLKLGPIVAILLDGKPMPVREKGPMFVVYPFDQSADLRRSTYYERSIWQLKALEVE
jgi:hypothetical protein